MSSPLSKIAHKPKDIQAAQANNCWQVYLRAAPTKETPAPKPLRLIGSRTKKGKLEVWPMETQQWIAVAETDLIYQA